MRNKKCRKCGDYIPHRHKDENGKIWILSSRVFCINCSKLGSNNRKRDDPSILEKNIEYSTWSKEKKLKHQARIYKRKLQRKAKLIEMSGGKCIICGYSKCSRALTFHHRNPQDKKFGLSIGDLARPWEEILTEHAKCDLLCIRCHVELEDEKARVNMNTYRDILELIPRDYTPM